MWLLYILHTTYYILHTIYYILHTTYYILHTTYYILHTIYYILYIGHGAIDGLEGVIHPLTAELFAFAVIPHTIIFCFPLKTWLSTHNSWIFC